VDIEEREELKAFVRDTLGCECPDEVLRRIECLPGLELPGVEGKGVRLDVGGRLLVYVLPAAVEPTKLRAQLAAAVNKGIAERGREGFNRLRIVLAAADVAEVEGAARRAFNDCHCPDARIHLHVVAMTTVPETARPRP